MAKTDKAAAIWSDKYFDAIACGEDEGRAVMLADNLVRAFLYTAHGRTDRDRRAS